MDVRTICLGILSNGEATGYEIKKLFDEGGYQHFVEASFGSIYPALSRLTEEGLVRVRAEAQEKRPDRKVYSITPEGRTALVAALMKPLPEDKHRSAFAFAMLFSNLLPPDRVSAAIDTYIARCEGKLAQMAERPSAAQTRGERFVIGLGQAIFTAMLDYLRAHRAELEQRAAEAAE